MTVNEMIAELERERDAGHGEKEIKVFYWEYYGGDSRGQVKEVKSILYRPLKPYAHDFVEIV